LGGAGAGSAALLSADTGMMGGTAGAALAGVGSDFGEAALAAA
jgi:hypothetical protein